MKESIKKCSMKASSLIKATSEKYGSSNDSDSAGKLEIVTTPDKRSAVRCNKKRKRKQRRVLNDDSEDSEEALIDQAIEEKLQEVARKNNLSHIEMKKLLKKLVGNEHVLALVKIQEDEEKRIEEKAKPGHVNTQSKLVNHEDYACLPKLTRAKARALNKQPIPLPALNDTEPQPEVAALISQELHSDEDDDEYHPHEEDLASDDDPNTTISDIDSQPPTPNNPTTPIQLDTPIHYSQDGIFKVPRDRNDSFNSQTSQHEEIIAKRTRSKLCLQTTAIETIESNFVPPDITTDMYDLDVDMDHAWMEFLNEFSKPLNTATTVEEDDEADPEYVAADKVPIDREELRDVNISKKELSDLVTELFDGLVSSGIMAEDESSTLETPKKTLDRSSDRSPIKKRQKISDNPVQGCQQFESSSQNIFSAIDIDLNVTQTEGTFNPNIMSTPQNSTIQKFTCGDVNQQHANMPPIDSYQYYNPQLSTHSPATPILPQAPLVGYSGSSVPSSGTINSYSTTQSYPTPNMGGAIPIVSIQASNSIYSVSNPSPALLAFQIPSTSAQSSTIPYQFAIPPTNASFGTILALPALNNKVGHPAMSKKTIDLTQSTEYKSNNSLTPISPIGCNIQSTSSALKPTTSHPEPSLPQSTATPEKPAKKRKKRRTSYNDLSYFQYDKWRNDVHVSINRYMRREYAEKYEDLKTITIEEVKFDEDQIGFTDFQMKILQQQMQIHVQFAAQNFFQTYSHPEFWKLAEPEKQMLLDLEKRSDGRVNSSFNPCNLKPALILVKEWEDELSVNNYENREFMDFFYTEIDKAKNCHNHTTAIIKFHPRVMKRIVSSKAFMYPDLLPKIPFRVNVNIPYHEFCPAEDHLIALGMERYFKQFQEEEENNRSLNKRKFSKLRIVCERIARDITVGKNWRRILGRVNSLSESEEYNPIKFFNERKRSPPFRHEIKPINFNLAPEDRIPDLPLVWKDYVLLLKSVHLDKLFVPQQHYVEPLKKYSEEIYQGSSREIPSFTLENNINHSQDNDINSANIVIHFNYVLDSSLTNHSDNLRKLLGSNFSVDQEQKLTISGCESILEGSEQKNHILRELVLHERSDRELDIPENDNSLNFISKECNNYSSTTPCSSRAASSIGKTSLLYPLLNEDLSAEKTNEKQGFKATKGELHKGQKLLTDYFPIQHCNTSKCKEESCEGREKSFTPKYLKRTIKKTKIKFYRLNHHKFLSKNHSKILNEVKRTKRLKIKFCFLVKSYHIQLENLRKKYNNEDLKCIFVHFKTLELYTNLLIDLMMTCRKGKSNVNSEEIACPKKAKWSNETAPNAKVRKAMRVNEYLKRMITPENSEDINKKDAIYALNFYDKVEEAFKKAGRNESFRKFQNILNSFDPNRDQVADMYYKIEKLFLPHYPELAQIFLTFLLPGEAAQVGKFFEHFIMSNMGTFISKLNLYFSKQPAQIKKVYTALNELSEDGDLTVNQIKEKILPLLKGNQFLTEWFLQIFPSEKPPERLVTISESINFKKIESHKSLAECENIPLDELISQPSDDEGCQIKYLNGRIFYGSKILLPAKLTFLADDLAKYSDTESDEDNSLKEKPVVCMHGMRDLAEKRLKQATEACDEPEKSEEDENRENSKNYIVCDNPTFKAHAIRLNPSLYTSDKANHHKRTLSPKKATKPILSTVIKDKEKEKRKSPKKNLPKSPGTKRNPSNFQSSNSMSPDPASKAIGTAKKLKSMMEGNLSDDQIKSKKQKTNDKIKLKEENDTREAGDEIIVDDNLSDTESSQGNDDGQIVAEVKAAAWTRDEDKIILEEVKFGFDSEEILIDKLAKNLPHRTESEIIHRHQFLMDVLSQLQSRT